MEYEINIWSVGHKGQSQYVQFFYSNLSVKWDPSCYAKLLCTQGSLSTN